MEKLTHPYTINLDKDTAQQVEKLARYYQRKPAEFLRLILAPILRDYWVKMQQEEHQENNDAPTLARFTK
jgi:hypothetical protein